MGLQVRSEARSCSVDSEPSGATDSPGRRNAGSAKTLEARFSACPLQELAWTKHWSNIQPDVTFSPMAVFFGGRDEQTQLLKRNTGMGRLFFQLIAVATSLILASPPGFCSIVVPRKSAAVTKSTIVPRLASVRRCRSCPVEDQSGQRQIPAESGWHCCCSLEPRLTQKPVPPPDAPAAVLAVTCDDASDLQWVRVADIESPTPSGPRRHVLLCVWRC